MNSTNHQRLVQLTALVNRLVHEYLDKHEGMAPALESACRFTGRVHKDYASIREYAVNNLSVTIQVTNSER